MKTTVDAPEVAPDCVRRLIDHLDRLESNSQERLLKWEEDETAACILKMLCPKEHLELTQCVEAFLHESNKPFRTLSQWYGIALHVAEHLEWD